jgi:hypothetical protein
LTSSSQGSFVGLIGVGGLSANSASPVVSSPAAPATISSVDHSADAWCAAPAPPAPATTTPVATGGAPMTQTITVNVPPAVRVVSDSDGVLGVITNAARPPAPGEDVYLLQADGGYAPADQALVNRVMHATWADGSWCSTTEVHYGATAG